VSDTDTNLTDEELAELSSKRRDDMTGKELHAYATQVLGLDVPEKVTDKAALAYIIDLAERSPAEASGVAGEPDTTQEDVTDLGDGYVEARRPITEVRDNGDWRDPFSGLIIWHGQHSSPQSGAVVNIADKARASRNDPVGHAYQPVKPGDVAMVRRLKVED
jgi:hypothetical protein